MINQEADKFILYLFTHAHSIPYAIYTNDYL